VRTYKDSGSPWGVGVYYEDKEFEAMMDEARLRGGTDVLTVGEGIDVDLVLQKGYGVSPEIVELPEGVLGRTTFHSDGKVLLELNRELADEAERSVGARHRLRSTLGHECGHIVLHGHLYSVDQGPSLFGGAPVRSAGVLCRSGDIRERPDYGVSRQWWEYQANRAMAALLLPVGLFRKQVEETLKRMGIADARAALAAGRGREFVGELASAFDVSLDMTVYRLQERGWLPKNIAQYELGLT
jgi:hypothetical protein